MTQRTKYHVTGRSHKEWRVKAEGAERSAGVFDTKAEAVKRARELGNNSNPAQVFIHGSDGKIQTEHTYGGDPFPPKG